MKGLYLFALLALCARSVLCQNMTLMSGQVIALNELYKATNWTCCIPRSTLGDFTPIVRMDGSGGQYYVTADPDCKTAPIPAQSYPAEYQAIWACGKCQGSNCPQVDGGLYLALPGDWCVDQNNKQDPNVVCSTQAPVCDEGYTGKCIALPTDATKPVSGPSMTLQSGQVVDLVKLANEYQGQCCLPRSVINDFTPIIRLDNSNGNYFVSFDPNCGSPIVSSQYPAMFEYINVCGQCPPGGCVQNQVNVLNGGVTLVQSGGTCDPYNYYGAGCWGAAPMCVTGVNQCIGIPYYSDYYYDDGCYSTFDCGGGGWGGWGWGSWGYYRPIWWRPLFPVFRPPFWRPPLVRPRPPGIWWPIRPRPPGWKPGRPIPGWRPGHREPGWRPLPDNIWKPPSGWKPGRPNRPVPLPGGGTVGGLRPGGSRPGGTDGRPPRPDTGRPAGPGFIPGRPGSNNGAGNNGGGPGGVNRPGVSQGGSGRPGTGGTDGQPGRPGRPGTGGPGGPGGPGAGQPETPSGGAGAGQPGRPGAGAGSGAGDGGDNIPGRPGRPGGPGAGAGGAGGGAPGGGGAGDNTAGAGAGRPQVLPGRPGGAGTGGGAGVGGTGSVGGDQGAAVLPGRPGRPTGGVGGVGQVGRPTGGGQTPPPWQLRPGGTGPTITETGGSGGAGNGPGIIGVTRPAPGIGGGGNPGSLFPGGGGGGGGGNNPFLGGGGPAGGGNRFGGSGRPTPSRGGGFGGFGGGGGGGGNSNLLYPYPTTSTGTRGPGLGSRGGGGFTGGGVGRDVPRFSGGGLGGGGPRGGGGGPRGFGK